VAPGNDLKALLRQGRTTSGQGSLDRKLEEERQEQARKREQLRQREAQRGPGAADPRKAGGRGGR
jgi:hypothetical protein